MARHENNGAKPGSSYIAGFVCNWAAYSGVEMAGVDERDYPTRVRLIRLPCLGRLHLGLLLHAFELGAGGVIMLGCPSQECSYEAGMERAKQLYIQGRHMLQLLGIDARRLSLVEVPVGGGKVVAKELNAFCRRITRLDAAKAKEADKVPATT